MVTPDPTRRRFCFGLAGLAGLTATRLRAEDIVELEWRDLIPPGETSLPPELQGLIPHD